MSLTERILDFVLDDSLEIPEAAVASASRLLADCLACAVAALQTQDPGTILLLERAVDIGGKGEASIWGHRCKLPADTAAEVNGMMAHALDYDDYTLSSWIGHPSVVLFPALFAVAEREGHTLADVLRAYIVGYEVGARLGLAAGQQHYENGWHNTSTLGVVAAAAALIELLRPSRSQARGALSIAASRACGLKRNFGTMTKPLHAGFAARSAVGACDLAVAGLSAADEALGGAQGLLAALAGKNGDHFDANTLAQLDTLGKVWDIVEPGVGIKPYPSCAYSHWAIDAATQAVSVGIRYEQIKNIIFNCSAVVPQVCIYQFPRTCQEGKFSLPYCVGLIFTGQACTLDEFRNVAIDDKRIQSLMERCTYLTDPGFDDTPWGGGLLVETLDNVQHRFEVRNPKGSPDNPLSEADLKIKIEDCTRKQLGHQQNLYDYVRESVEKDLPVADLLDFIRDG